MKTYVLDTNAVMRYLQQGPGFERVRELFKMVLRGDAHLSMSVINWGEVLYVLGRRAGLEQASDALKSLSGCIELASVTEERARSAATLKLRFKLGYADCFAAALALETGARLVTADPEFARLGKQLKILALPRHSA